MPGVNFLLAADLLGGFLIDLLHVFVGGRGLALDREQIVHQQPVAREGEAGLEVVAVGDLLVLGFLGDDLHVDQEGQHVLLLGRGIHLRQARSQFLLRHRDVAGADFGAVDFGKHRIGILGANRKPGEQRKRKTARHGGRGEAEFHAG